ncbi:hypothetical protein FACS189456_5310 [Bacteroidia bacterium]|nr:hypothetical protein FACS189456_5310 [Bacteroidia bacterium]
MKKLLLLSAVAVIFAACEGLDDINVNPNATEKPQPAYLLTGVEKQGADLYWGGNANIGTSLLFVQHWAKIQYPEGDRYEFSNSSGEVTTIWNTGYATLVTDLNTILAFPDAEANPNYKGIALTLRSWVFQLLTETYGDIPYKEAGQSLVPVYNTQKEVYTGILADLTEALLKLDPAAGSVKGDVVYGGDIAKWRKFAASLQLRIALRIADRESALSKSTIDGLNLTELIGSNAETFKFTFSNSPQHNPQAAAFDTRDDYRISKTVVDKLTALSDPRLPIFAQMPKDTDIYVGAGNGLSNSDAQNQGLSRTSLPGRYFLTPTAPAVIYSYAEVLFNLAEAVERGYIIGNAVNYYNAAITASLEQYEIASADIATYLAQPAVQYSSAAGGWKQAIGEQKWIALFGQGPEAFTEWRRLDYPVLVAGPASVLDGKIPLRLFYPGTEQSLNRTNREQAVASQGADELTTRLWFDAH